MKLYRVSIAFIYLLLTLTLAGYSHAAPKIHPLHLETNRWIDYTHATIRDQQGFLWIATDEDLKRYDGYTLRSFTNDVSNVASIAPGSIRCLMLQSNGSLWAAGANLSQYHVETESFTSFSITNQKTIRSIYEDPQGFFWLGGEGFGLLRFDPRLGEVTHTFTEEPFKDNIWKIISHSSTTKFWVASDKGIYLFDGQTFELDQYTIPLELETGVEAIRAIAEDQTG